MPMGTVTFYDNGTSLGSVAVSGGAASLTLSTLPVGGNVITAAYSGDSQFNPAAASTSVTVTVTALVPAFTLSATTPASLSLTQGVVTATLDSNATFSGSVGLSCSGMPAESSCTISPGTITLAGSQTALVSVVVITTPPNNTFEAKSVPSAWGKPTAAIGCAGLLVLLRPGSKRRRRNLWMMLCIVCLGLAATSALTGCGNAGYTYPGTTVGTSTLTLTATSGSITHSTTFTVNIVK